MRELFSEIHGVIPNVRIIALSEAEDLLEAMNVSDHQSALTNMYSGDALLTGLETGTTIETIYYNTIVEQLAIFGVRVTEDVTSVAEVTAILRGIYSLADPFNMDIIEDTLEEETNAQETLAKLLASVELHDMFWFLERFDYVDPDLIIRVKAEINDVEFYQEASEIQADIVNRYRDYMDKDKQGVVYENLDDISFLPMNFRTMTVALQTELRELSVSELTEELYQLNILSDSDDGDFIDNVRLVGKAFFNDNLQKQTELESIAERKIS